MSPLVAQRMNIAVEVQGGGYSSRVRQDRVPSIFFSSVCF
jgi:hypothetical protein